MEYLRDIMAYHKDVTGLHVFSGDYGCEVCKNGVTNGFWRYDYDDRPLVEFDKEIPAFITKDPAGDIIKKKWEAEGSVIQAKEYLEKTCIENLKKYRDYKKAN
nr:zinc-alpha-2-glycoprotein-like isoform X1 [Phascolarctos cinereus]